MTTHKSKDYNVSAVNYYLTEYRERYLICPLIKSCPNQPTNRSTKNTQIVTICTDAIWRKSFGRERITEIRHHHSSEN